MQLLSADTVVLSKRFRKSFWHRKHEKNALKSCSYVIGPLLLFMYWPGCPNGSKTEILYQQKPLRLSFEIHYCGLSQFFWMRSYFVLHFCSVKKPLWSIINYLLMHFLFFQVHQQSQNNVNSTTLIAITYLNHQYQTRAWRFSEVKLRAY